MKILVINASFRKGSFNKLLSDVVINHFKDKIEFTSLEIEELPYFSQDLESALPIKVLEASKKVVEADGIFVFSPEYNYEIPGVLKNAFDWLSRIKPDGTNSILVDKPVTIAGTGGKNATANMQARFFDLAKFLKMKVFEDTYKGILPVTVWKTGTYEVEEETKEKLISPATKFFEFVKEAK